jgi:putative hemolysin
MPMQDRINTLIAERAPWLYRDGQGRGIARAILHKILGYDRTIAIAQDLADAPAEQIMQTMTARLAQRVSATGFGHLPLQGAALIVANHPTGIADGIILHHLISARRPDAYFFANRDILRVFPQMDAMIAPVEWRQTLRSHAKTRATMAYVRQATDAGRLGVIFPSGRLAQRCGLGLRERPWMHSAAMLAHKYDLPVIPVNIQARNSALFYLFDKIHPTLRDITLFHETLNKHRQPFVVTMGAPISPSAIPRDPAAGIAMLRAATLELGGRQDAAVDLLANSRFWPNKTARMIRTP